MDENKRRKDYCITCKLFKPIKAKNKCQNCWHKYKRRYNRNFFLRTRYTELKQRCINPNKSYSKYYFGLEYCSLKEFLDKFKKDINFLKLFKQWQKTNFKYKLCPSIDRIDNSKGYLINNLQFITHSENSTKDQKTLKIEVYNKSGEFISEHASLNDAVRYYNVQQSNAWKVVYGYRKHTKGFIFKIKKDT